MQFINKLLEKKKVILFICVVLIATGIFSYNMIPKQRMSDTTPPIGSYQIIAPGYTAEEVYDSVVAPMEEAILDVDRITDVVGNSFDNFAVITIVLDVKENKPDEIWAQVTKAVDETLLPDDIMEPVFNSDFDFPHAVYSVSAEELTRLEIEDAAGALANSISFIDDVKSVDISYESGQSVNVTVDMDELNKLPLTMENIAQIIGANGMNIPLGSITDDNSSFSIEAPMVYTDISELEDLVLFTDPMTGNAVLLSDIAKVELETIENQSKLYANGEDAVFLSVYFNDGLDFTKLGDSLDEVVDGFTAANDVTVGKLVFQPDYVKASINQVNSSLLQGILFVLIVILIGLGFRNALSVAFTFPLIVFSTILCLFVLKQPIQMTSIAGLIITIGIIVDNSIVIGEAIQHHLDVGKEKKQAISLAVKENAMPVLSSTLTTIAAFAVLMFLPGVAGKMMFALPLTVIIAISLSYLVAMLIMPIFGGILFKPRKKKKERKSSGKGNAILNKMVSGALKQPLAVVILSLFIFVLLTPLATMGDVELFPATQDSIVYINYEYTGDTSDMSTEEFAKELANVAYSYDNIEYMAYSVGGDLPRFDSSLSNLSPLPTNGRVYLRFDADYDTVKSNISSLKDDLKQFDDISNISVSELFYGPEMGDIIVYINASDIEKATNVSQKIEDYLISAKDVTSYAISYPSYQDKYQITLDREKLADNGLMAAQAQMQIRNILSPVPASQMNLDGEKIGIMLSTDIKDVDSLAQSGIMLQSQMTKIELSELAEITSESSLFSLTTRDGSYQMQISITVEDMMASAPGVLEKVNSIIDSVDTKGLEISYGGMAQEAGNSMGNVGVAGVIAVVIIFLIMLMQFGSFKQPLIVLITIPLSFIGSFLALIIFRTGMTFTVLLGMVALMGIVVNSGILLIDYINKARQDGMALKEACIKSVERRIRPILLSSGSFALF
jgi:multidrug efflux pump